MSKMDWYCEALINGERERDHFVIQKSGKNFGTVCMPTGTGKSAVIFDDIISSMISSTSKGAKCILSLAAPILKLKNQTVSDFLEIISNSKVREYLLSKGVDVSENNLCIINNSSYTYKATDNLRGYSAYAMKDREAAIKMYSFVLVDNCLRSFNKYLTALKELTKEFEVINYFDESHKVNIDNKNIAKVFDDSGDDNCVSYIDIDKLHEYSNKIISISATPHVDLIEKLNNFQHVSFADQFGQDNKKRFIYCEIPSEAIRKGTIVAPEPTLIIQTEDSDEGKVDVESLEQVFKLSKKDHPQIHSKILVNCHRIREIEDLKSELTEKGYRVFYTYSGADQGNKIQEEVDAFEGDCFILHCKQLIAGIDINSITDTVQYVGSHNETAKDEGNEGEANITLYKETPIQTIGRSMRSYKGERGMKVSERKKPHAGAYFICKEGNALAVDKAIRVLWCRYYQVGIINFKFFRKDMTEPVEKDIIQEREMKDLTAEYLRASKVDFSFMDEIASYLEYRGIFTNESILEQIQDLIREKTLVFTERLMKGQQFLTGTEEWKENIAEILPSNVKAFIRDLQLEQQK